MEELKHSGLGIASFCISIAAGSAYLYLYRRRSHRKRQMPGGMDEESVTAVPVGLALITFLFASWSHRLGIGGLFQKERKKVSAILGTIFSGADYSVTAALIAIGLAMVDGWLYDI